MVADCSSCYNDLNALFEEMDALDFEAMSKAQKVDPKTLNLACSNDHSLDFNDFTKTNLTTVCEARHATRCEKVSEHLHREPINQDSSE